MIFQGRLLGIQAIDLLDGRHPTAVLAVVDADDKGVNNRERAFQNRFKGLYPQAEKAKAGVIVEGHPRLGLWVAPNNADEGVMDELLIKAARRYSAKLLARGERFVKSIGQIEPLKNGGGRHKAVLGAINQTVSPGASLASVLNKTHCRFDASLKEVSPFKDLLAFIEELTAPPAG